MSQQSPRQILQQTQRAIAALEVEIAYYTSSGSLDAKSYIQLKQQVDKLKCLAQHILDSQIENKKIKHQGLHISDCNTIEINIYKKYLQERIRLLKQVNKNLSTVHKWLISLKNRTTFSFLLNFRLSKIGSFIKKIDHLHSMAKHDKKVISTWLNEMIRFEKFESQTEGLQLNIREIFNKIGEIQKKFIQIKSSTNILSKKNEWTLRWLQQQEHRLQNYKPYYTKPDLSRKHAKKKRARTTNS